jgi:hypothetical protein
MPGPVGALGRRALSTTSQNPLEVTNTMQSNSLESSEYPDSRIRPRRSDALVPDLSKEKHYSIPEVALMWGFSRKTVRRLFENEPGIVEIGHEESRSKRSYKTRRIPESVLQRVHRRLRKSA